jgi:CRISPR-associated endoribonuclease Cas6
MRTRGSIILPLAYNELLQGVLYSCWRDGLEFVHNATLNDGRAFRPFVFSRLEGRTKADGKARTIRLNGLVSFEMRSCIEEFVDACASHLYSRGVVRLGAYDLDLVNLECRDRLLFPQRARVRLRTPVVAYRTLEDDHKEYYSPSDPEWLDLVRGNTLRKVAVLATDQAANVQAFAYEETLRKQVTRFKGTFITGWTGDLLLACDPEVMALLWCCGIGAKNSQGFGMFDIVDGWRV